MKTMDALKIGGVVVAGVAAYLIVTKAAKTGGKVVEAVKETITKDINPASTENVIYKNLPESVQRGVGDFLGFVFDNANYRRNKQIMQSGGVSNVKNQAELLAPTGAVSGQSSPGFAAKDPRRVDLPNYVNPFASAAKIDYKSLNVQPEGMF
jgi:hypothetical protein